MQTIRVIPWGEPFIPNTFTPNGDGAHDNFEIYYADLQGIDLQIFDRWGTRLFQTYSPDNLWDGNTDNNKACGVGIYYYALTASKPGGEKVVYKGWVSLMR